MKITYESICEKLGFDPFVNPPKPVFNGHEDDSQENPYSILTFEESDFLAKLAIERFKSGKSFGGNKKQE